MTCPSPPTPHQPITQAAIADLNQMSAFHGPTAGGQVTAATLFRGNITGGLTGPYISQFFWQPVPVNSTVVSQLYRAGAAGIDYLNTWDEWLVLQTGVPFSDLDSIRSGSPWYIYNGRSLAEWVHYDFLYQAYHNAALILLNQSPDSVLNSNPYLNPTNPYKTTKGVETGFCDLSSTAHYAVCSAQHVKRRCWRRGSRNGWCIGGRARKNLA